MPDGAEALMGGIQHRLQFVVIGAIEAGDAILHLAYRQRAVVDRQSAGSTGGEAGQAPVRCARWARRHGARARPAGFHRYRPHGGWDRYSCGGKVRVSSADAVIGRIGQQFVDKGIFGPAQQRQRALHGRNPRDSRVRYGVNRRQPARRSPPASRRMNTPGRCKSPRAVALASLSCERISMLNYASNSGRSSLWRKRSQVSR